MNEIRSLLRMASRKLDTRSFLNVFHVVAVVMASICLAVLVIDRLPAEAFMPWMAIIPAVVAVALIISVIVWMPRRISEAQVAVIVDERLHLKEKLSTALACQESDDPFARAAIEDAVKAASDPRTRELAGRRFTVGAPRGWWVSPLLVLVAMVGSFLDPLDLFSSEEPQANQVELARGAVNQSIDAVVEQIEDNPLLKTELSDLMGDLTTAGTDPDALRTPDEIRREAIKDVTELNKRLDELINGEKGKSLEAIEESLGDLKPQDGNAKELSEALARADFKSAQAALQEMMDKIESGKMSKEEQEKLAEQLEDIAKQLQQLANQQNALEKALEQAGMNPQLAQDPQALQQAIQNNQNLNQQQKQQLQQMAQAQQAAAQQCQGMGQAMQQMAQGMMNGQMGQMGQAGQQMGQQLNQMEMMQQMLQQAQAAANMCQGQSQGLGQGLGMSQAMQQWSQTQGQGGAFGKRGQGAGGKAPISPTPYGTRLQKADTTLTEGDIIAKTLFDGPQIRGESRAKLREILTAETKTWEDGIPEDELPRRYHEVQMHYFGELEKLSEVRDAAGPASAATEAEAESTSGNTESNTESNE